MLAIVTDSTCDMSAEELNALNVTRVPLYVNHNGEAFRDWLEIDPKRIIADVQSGSAIPSTSQPSPQDFEKIYNQVIAEGADQILCITISGELSGTFQSANIAKENVSAQVSVFDSRAATIGMGNMVKHAAKMRDDGADMASILKAIEHIRDTNKLLFTVGNLDFLQKNGRIGGAQAMLGSLLNIKPILTLTDGKVEAAGRARGTKKVLKEIVSRAHDYADNHPRDLNVTFLHIQDEAAAATMKGELEASGITFKDMGTYEIGAVIATHVGPSVFGLYMYTEPDV